MSKEVLNDKNAINAIIAKHHFKLLAKKIKEGAYSYGIRDEIARLAKDIDPQIIKLLFEEKDDDGNSLLHLAIEKGDSVVFDELIKKKPNLNLKNEAGDTALSLALKKGDLSSSYRARDLIKAEADLDIQYEKGNTAIHLAIEKGDSVVFDELIKKKPNLNLKNEAGDTALSLALKKGDLSSSYRARALIKAGADLDIQYEKGNTAIHLAIEKGDSVVFDELIKRKPNLNLKNEAGDTALSLALKKGDLSSSYRARALIKAGADLDIQYENGNTALHLAIEKGDTAILDSLINAGANLKSANNEGDTPLSLAFKKGQISIACELLKRSDNLEVVLQDLVNKGIDLNAKDKHGYTVLHYAAQTNGVIIDSLIKAGANVNIQDNHGSTPLHLSVSSGRNQVVTEKLIAAGAEINAKDGKGNTVLHLAHDVSNIDRAKKLMALGANLTIKNNKGELPQFLRTDDQLVDFFKLAVKEGDIATVKILTTHFGEKLKGKYLTNISGRTLHSYAKTKGKEDIATLLEMEGFKKQKSLTDYIMPAKKVKKAIQQFDNILDKAELGEAGIKPQGEQAKLPKKSWKKYLKEKFYPKKEVNSNNARSNSLEMLEQGKLKQKDKKEPVR